MREGYRALFDRDALLKHVIFLSDGQMTRGDFAALIRRMVKDKITVSGVAIGSDADVQLMNDVSKWGRGRFYFTEETSTVPRIFTLETQLASKASLIEQPFKAIVTGPHHEAIQDIDWPKAPPLGGYVATSIKGTADQVLMTHQEDPLLAAWRYGLGRSVAFTADARAKWGMLWLRWGAYNKFWAQVVRWTLRANTRSDTTVSVERRDGQARRHRRRDRPEGRVHQLPGRPARRGESRQAAVGGRASSRSLPAGTAAPSGPGTRACTWPV